MIWIHSSPEIIPAKHCRQPLSLDGVLLIDKPYGCSSFDVIRRLKRCFGFTKLGHAGTLDPLATGLLIIVLGKATKLSQHLMCGIKEYTGVIQLGVETSTYDREGEVIATHPVTAVNETELVSTMNTFVGDQYQHPPMFSAKKFEGTPLYKLARKGHDVERTPNFITIFKFCLEKYEQPDVYFHVRCSKGTYIRSLAHDLGEKMKCGGHLAALRRIKSGTFSLENAVDLNTLLERNSVQFLKQYVIPIEKVQQNQS